jgi:hypothetical protein
MCCCCCFCCDPVVFASSVVFLAREKTEFPFLSGGKGLVFDRFQQPGASRGAAGHHRGARGRKDENLSFRYYYHLPIEKRMYHAATQYTQYIIPQSCRVDSISLLIYYCTRVPGYCTVRYHIYTVYVYHYHTVLYGLSSFVLNKSGRLSLPYGLGMGFLPSSSSLTSS